MSESMLPEWLWTWSKQLAEDLGITDDDKIDLIYHMMSEVYELGWEDGYDSGFDEGFDETVKLTQSD